MNSDKLLVLSCVLATSSSCHSTISKQEPGSLRVGDRVVVEPDTVKDDVIVQLGPNEKIGQIRVVPVGFSIGRHAISIEAMFSGPCEVAEMFATALAGAVLAAPEEWLEIVDPRGGAIEYGQVDPMARIQFADPSRTAVYEVNGNSVRFTYSLGPLTKEEPIEGTYTYRLRADGPYRKLAADFLLEDVGIQIDSHQYQSTAQRRLSAGED